MPTPMYIFNEIAARYGVDPKNQDAVKKFYTETIQTLNPEEQQAIAEELLARDGETKPPSQTPETPKP